jgi:hypothetical protein
MKWETTEDRQKEFLMMKKKVDSFLVKEWNGQDLFSLSCEVMAEQLALYFDASFVSVFEDNENGAEYHAI